jgi:hypothetical protein
MLLQRQKSLHLPGIDQEDDVKEERDTIDKDEDEGSQSDNE